MSNTNIQAQEIRDRLLLNGIEIIEQVEKIALHGDDEYDGDIKALNLMVKLISPMISMRDDKIKITKEDRETYEDRLVQLAMNGDINVTLAQEYLTVITKSRELGDLREVISKLDQLEMTSEK